MLRKAFTSLTSLVSTLAIDARVVAHLTLIGTNQVAILDFFGSRSGTDTLQDLESCKG